MKASREILASFLGSNSRFECTDLSIKYFYDIFLPRSDVFAEILRKRTASDSEHMTELEKHKDKLNINDILNKFDQVKFDNYMKN